MGSQRSLAARGAARLGLVGVFLGIGLSTGCPTVDLGDTPTEIGLCNPAGGVQYFQDQIWPNFVQLKNPAQTCSQLGCHIRGGNGLDFPDPVDYPTAYRRSQIYLNCGNPEASLFLTKPLAGVEAHAGGDIFPDVNDPAVVIFLNWFK